MPYGQILTDSITDSSGGVLAPSSSVFRNRIINGDMRIDQRNAGASVTPTDGQYTVDRWNAGLTQASKFSVQQNAGSVTPPVGFTKYLGVTSLTAYSVISTDLFRIAQNIEGFNVADLGWGTANAQTITLSFWVRSSLTGTFGGSLLNSAAVRSYPFTFTINSANTWEKETITIAGDTSGTWLADNGVGIRLNISLGAGATYSGTAGAWAAGTFTSATGAISVVGTSGATFYVTGVQLEKGTTATSFDYRPYGTELQLCQRYFESTAFPDVPGIGITSTRIGICLVGATTTSSGFNFLVPKRTNAPTVTLYSRTGTSGKVSLVATGADVAGTSSAASINGTGFWGVSLGAAQTAGAGIETGWTASAEL